MKKLLLLTAVVGLAYLISFLWWKFWMYEGVIGPFPILHPFFEVEGEASYDLTQAEMFIHLMAAVLVVWFVCLKARYPKA